MNSIEKKGIIGMVILISTFLVGPLLYRSYFLNKHQFTYAIYKGTEGSAWGKSQIVEFEIKNGDKIRAEIYHTDGLKVGDTIWVKYAIQKPTIVEVVDKEYKNHLKID